MEIINHKKMVDHWVKKSGILAYFSASDLDFSLFRFSKGEYLASPDTRLEHLLFVTEGAVRVYGSRQDGSVVPVNQQSAPVMIGDIEFIRPGTPFYALAASEVTCLAVSMQKYGQQLHGDVKFLHVLLQSYVDKLQLFAFVDAQAQTIEERVLLYLQHFCPSQELCGIEGAILQLRCSRRQLQRVLSRLCETGKLQKMGKGRYRLVSQENTET